jgi:hypothetical protein
MTETPRGILGKEVLKFLRKKARFIFVFLMFCCVKFLVICLGKTPVISLKIPLK